MKLISNVGIIASFKDIFPDEDSSKLSVDILLQGISRKAIILTMSYLNIALFYDRFSKDFQNHMLQIWTNNFPNEVKSNIHFLSNLSIARQNKFLYFFNIQANLILIENSLKVCVGESTYLTPQQELNFFKAYLLINQELQSEQIFKLNQNSKEKLKSLDDIYFNRILPMMVASGEHIIFNPIQEIYTQVYKGILLFKFIENHKEFNKPYYDKFL